MPPQQAPLPRAEQPELGAGSRGSLAHQWVDERCGDVVLHLQLERDLTLRRGGGHIMKLSIHTAHRTPPPVTAGHSGGHTCATDTQLHHSNTDQSTALTNLYPQLMMADLAAGDIEHAPARRHRLCAKGLDQPRYKNTRTCRFGARCL